MDFLKKLSFNSSKNSEDSNETLNSEMDLVNREAIVKVENEHTKTSFFSNLTEKTGIFFSDLGVALNDKYAAVSDATVRNYNESANRMSSFSDSAINMSSEFKNTLVVYKTDIAHKYNEIEIKSNLLKIISTLDCEKIVSSLELLKRNDKKTILAISITQQIILTLNRHTKAIEIENDELNREVNSILNSIDIKEVIKIIEPFCPLFPYGGTVLCIIKLFVK